MSDSERLARIREVTDDRFLTPAPWLEAATADETGTVKQAVTGFRAEDGKQVEVIVAEAEGNEPEDSADMEFIAEARTAVPYLLSLLGGIAEALRFEKGDEDGEWFIPAEHEPLGPFDIVEACREFMAFIDHTDKLMRDEKSEAESRVSRAEQAAKEAEKQRDIKEDQRSIMVGACDEAIRERRAAESSLAAERARVIEECAREVERGMVAADFSAETRAVVSTKADIASRIRKLATEERTTP